MCPNNSSTPTFALNTKDAKNFLGSQVSEARRCSTYITNWSSLVSGKNKDNGSKKDEIINFLGGDKENITGEVTSVGGKKGGKGGDSKPGKRPK